MSDVILRDSCTALNLLLSNSHQPLIKAATDNAGDDAGEGQVGVEDRCASTSGSAGSGDGDDRRHQGSQDQQRHSHQCNDLHDASRKLLKVSIQAELVCRW